MKMNWQIRNEKSMIRSVILSTLNKDMMMMMMRMRLTKRIRKLSLNAHLQADVSLSL